MKLEGNNLATNMEIIDSSDAYMFLKYLFTKCLLNIKKKCSGNSSETEFHQVIEINITYNGDTAKLCASCMQ